MRITWQRRRRGLREWHRGVGTGVSIGCLVVWSNRRNARGGTDHLANSELTKFHSSTRFSSQKIHNLDYRLTITSPSASCSLFYVFPHRLSLSSRSLPEARTISRAELELSIQIEVDGTGGAGADVYDLYVCRVSFTRGYRGMPWNSLVLGAISPRRATLQNLIRRVDVMSTSPLGIESSFDGMVHIFLCFDWINYIPHTSVVFMQITVSKISTDQMGERQRSTGSRNESCTLTISLQPCQRQVSSRVESERETSYRRISERGQRVWAQLPHELDPLIGNGDIMIVRVARVRPAHCRDARLKLSVAGSSCGCPTEATFL